MPFDMNLQTETPRVFLIQSAKDSSKFLTVSGTGALTVGDKITIANDPNFQFRVYKDAGYIQNLRLDTVGGYVSRGANPGDMATIRGRSATPGEAADLQQQWL